MDAFISGITGLIREIAALILAVFLLINGRLLISSMTKVARAIALLAATRKREWESRIERLVATADLLASPQEGPTRPAQYEGYSTAYFARKHRISKDEAERIIRRVGNDRGKLNRAAERTKRKQCR